MQTYQRCVHIRNAMAKFLDTLLSINSWARLWTLFISWISFNKEEEETQLFTQHLPQKLKTAVYTALAQSHHYHQSMTFITESHDGHEVKERSTKTVSLFENSCKCWTWMKLNLIIKKMNLYDDLINCVIPLKFLSSPTYFLAFKRYTYLYFLFVCFKLWKPFTAEVTWII